MKPLPVIFERNEADFGAIAGHHGEKIQRNCSQKEPKEQDKINFRQARLILPQLPRIFRRFVSHHFIVTFAMQA
ncbi:MAG: hypothetical protein U0X71_01095 [Sphingobacteriaceae bacterium]